MTLSVCSRPLSCALSSCTPCHILTVNSGQTFTHTHRARLTVRASDSSVRITNCPCLHAWLKFTHPQLIHITSAVTRSIRHVKLTLFSTQKVEMLGPTFTDKGKIALEIIKKMNLQMNFSRRAGTLSCFPSVLSPSGSVGLRSLF